MPKKAHKHRGKHHLEKKNEKDVADIKKLFAGQATEKIDAKETANQEIKKLFHPNLGDMTLDILSKQLSIKQQSIDIQNGIN